MTSEICFIVSVCACLCLRVCVCVSVHIKRSIAFTHIRTIILLHFPPFSLFYTFPITLHCNYASSRPRGSSDCLIINKRRRERGQKAGAGEMSRSWEMIKEKSRPSGIDKRQFCARVCITKHLIMEYEGGPVPGECPVYIRRHIREEA